MRTLGLLLATAVVLYFGGFYGIEFLRHRQGAWQIVCLKDQTGTPRLLINQHWLGITNVTVVFTDCVTESTNLPFVRIFDAPRPASTNLPFGTVVFTDLTFLPGTVSLKVFDHELELLPRVLIIDGREHRWQGTSLIELLPSAGRASPERG